MDIMKTVEVEVYAEDLQKRIESHESDLLNLENALIDKCITNTFEKYKDLNTKRLHAENNIEQAKVKKSLLDKTLVAPKPSHKNYSAYLKAQTLSEQTKRDMQTIRQRSTQLVKHKYEINGTDTRQELTAAQKKEIEDKFVAPILNAIGVENPDTRREHLETYFNDLKNDEHVDIQHLVEESSSNNYDPQLFEQSRSLSRDLKEHKQSLSNFVDLLSEHQEIFPEKEINKFINFFKELDNEKSISTGQETDILDFSEPTSNDNKNDNPLINSDSILYTASETLNIINDLDRDILKNRLKDYQDLDAKSNSNPKYAFEFYKFFNDAEGVKHVEIFAEVNQETHIATIPCVRFENKIEAWQYLKTIQKKYGPTSYDKNLNITYLSEEKRLVLIPMFSKNNEDFESLDKIDLQNGKELNALGLAQHGIDTKESEFMKELNDNKKHLISWHRAVKHPYGEPKQPQ